MESGQLKRLKSLLRKKLRKTIGRIPVAEKRRKSRRIIERLVSEPTFRRSKKILTYVALPSEVETRELILKAFALRKRIFVPYLHPRRREILAYEIRHLGRDLRPGSYGILEPRPLLRRKGRAREFDLIIVPGLGFDRRGARLGRGKGYFDRFLRKANRAKKIGLAFREQLVKKIPRDSGDVAVDRVITD